MRLVRIVFITAVLIITAGFLYAESPRSELDALVENWTDALISENLDGFLDCYWDDSIRITYFPNGDSSVMEGLESLREEQKAANDSYDYPSMNLIYDEPLRFFPEGGHPTYIYPNSRYSFMDVFEFEKRRGRYKIIRQYLMPHPPQDQ